MPELLVAESDVRIARLIELNLQRQGYHVRIARDATATIDRMYTHRVDLLIAADDLRVVGGTDLIRALRREPRFNALPIILLMSRLTMRDETENKRGGHGEDWIVAKPFNPIELIQAVKHFAASPPRGPTGEWFSI